MKMPAPKRLVAIGDLHGDLDAMRAAFRTAGAIDASDTWIGKDLVVVQTGDILDRGDDERKMLDLVTKLEAEAKAAGGALIALVGNHELMNAAGDYRYVTPGGLVGWDGIASGPPIPAKVPELAKARFNALEPGGAYAKRFAQHDVVAIVGDVVLSHAGPLGSWASLERIEAANQAARCWLDGQAGDAREPPDVLTAQDSPVWTRDAGMASMDCAALGSSLKALGVKRMVVAHTPQKHINSLCDGALWRIDVGMSKAYNGPIEVLQLYPDAKVLSGSR